MPEQRIKPKVGEDFTLESALMADSRHKSRIVMTTEDDPVKADYINRLWRKLERESKRRNA